MNTHANKTQENKSQSVANGVSQMQSGGESTFQFADIRPVAVAQRKLQAMADASPRAMQLKSIQEIASNSPQAKQSTQLQAVANNKSVQQHSSSLLTQLMMIRGIDVNHSTSIGDLKTAMGWNSLLGQRSKELTPTEVKELITRIQRYIAEGSKDEDLEDMLESLQESSSSDDEDSGWDTDDIVVPVPVLEELKTKRLMSAEDFGWAGFPETHGGMKKLGVHETGSAKVFDLVKSGPAEKMMDTGHHLGKGPGFYVTHVGRKQLETVTKDVVYGDSFVAIYINSSVEEIHSEESSTDNTAILDKAHGDKLCYYVMSGGAEIVIPVRCFPHVKVVSVAQQILGCRDDKLGKAWMRDVFQLHEAVFALVEGVKKGTVFPMKSDLNSIENRVSALKLPMSHSMFADFVLMRDTFQTYGVM